MPKMAKPVLLSAYVNTDVTLSASKTAVIHQIYSLHFVLFLFMVLQPIFAFR